MGKILSAQSQVKKYESAIKAILGAIDKTNVHFIRVALENILKEISKIEGTQAPKIQKDTQAKYGEYGWVKLTDGQYQKLFTELGEVELKRCIEYVDESAQQTGNKNKWKDFNLTIRKCHREQWGRNKTQAQPQSAGRSVPEGFTEDVFLRKMMEG